MMRNSWWRVHVMAGACVLTLAAAVTPMPAFAMPQDGARTQLSPERLEQLQARLKQLEERLALTPEQKEQIRPILVDEMQQMKALREKSQGETRSRREKRRALKDLRAIQSGADKKLRGILSESQMSELKKIREEWRQQMRERAQAR